MAKEIWSEITDQERSIILKHLREQYEAICEICGKNSDEAAEAKAVYGKVLTSPLKDCWEDIECFYSEVSDSILAGMNADVDLVQMVTKVLEICNISAKEELDMMIAAGEERLGVGNKAFMDRHKKIMDMCDASHRKESKNMKELDRHRLVDVNEDGNGINSGVRKENYERGLQHGRRVYCGQDLKELIGLRVSDVNSDENDMNVIMYLEDEDKSISVYFDNMCLDGDSMSMVENVGGNCECLLRPATEADLKEISSMTRYYDNELMDEYDETVGVNHIYCNDISLEGTDQFRIKDLYVFYDGRIMTGK